MAKRRSVLTISEFIEGAAPGERSTRVREFRPEVHRVLCLLAERYAVANGYEVTALPAKFVGSPQRAEFTVMREIGSYFTTDEITHLAEYIRGAADALEAVEVKF